VKCEELLAALNEYVDGEIDPGICEAFENHLKGCNPCQIVVDNIRQTITLYKAGEPLELPREFHEQLCRRLRDKWRLKFCSDEPQSDPREQTP
jgi:anti-sigma factor RsiW